MLALSKSPPPLAYLLASLVMSTGIFISKANLQKKGSNRDERRRTEKEKPEAGCLVVKLVLNGRVI